MCPRCGAGPVWKVDRVLGMAPPGYRASAGADAGPPPPSFYDYERPRPVSRSSGPGLGFYVKAGLLVGGIFGVAAVATSVAQLTHEIRRTIRG